MFRLHIDIPVGHDEEYAKETSEIVLRLLRDASLLSPLRERSVDSINFRLGHDEDRQRSNYFQKTENGHVGHIKSKISTNTVWKEDE